MRNYFLLLALSVQFLAAAPTFIPPRGTPSEVLALINDYRAANGLPALVENPLLSYIAQAQADYLISQPMGTVGDVHEGPGGSRPKDRAYAAGYGGGENISVSEIVKGGIDETPSSAMAWWKTSPPHNNTMLTTYSQEFGAGAATDGNGRWWYVADFGYQAGGTYSPPAAAVEQPAAPIMVPVTSIVASNRPSCCWNPGGAGSPVVGPSCGVAAVDIGISFSRWTSARVRARESPRTDSQRQTPRCLTG